MKDYQEWKDRRHYAKKKFNVILVDPNSELAKMVEKSLSYQLWRIGKYANQAWAIIVKDFKNIFK